MLSKPTSPYPALDQETRAYVDTACAAFHLNRKIGTLQHWHSIDTYPGNLKPKKIHGRLSWPVAGLLEVLQGEPA